MFNNLGFSFSYYRVLKPPASRAEEMAHQWIKCLLHKEEGQGSDPQDPHKIEQVWSPPLILRTRRQRQGVPG